MPESLEHINKNASKQEKYQQVLAEIKSLVAHETDPIANLANISSVLKEIFQFWWVGFYLVKQNQLVLGPFQVRNKTKRTSKRKSKFTSGSIGLYKNPI